MAMPLETIQKALDEVRKHFPQVTMILFNTQQQWCAMDDDFNAPTFNDDVDIGFLEDAADVVPYLPYLFSIYYNDSPDESR